MDSRQRLADIAREVLAADAALDATAEGAR
jgi:hypothetical protein